MLVVVDDARVLERDGQVAWSEAFNELFAQVAGVFGNAAVRGHGRWYLLADRTPACLHTGAPDPHPGPADPAPVVRHAIRRRSARAQAS